MEVRAASLGASARGLTSSVLGWRAAAGPLAGHQRSVISRHYTPNRAGRTARRGARIRGVARQRLLPHTGLPVGHAGSRRARVRRTRSCRGNRVSCLRFPWRGAGLARFARNGQVSPTSSTARTGFAAAYAAPLHGKPTTFTETCTPRPRSLVALPRLAHGVLFAPVEWDRDRKADPERILTRWCGGRHVAALAPLDRRKGGSAPCLRGDAAGGRRAAPGRST